MSTDDLSTMPLKPHPPEAFAAVEWFYARRGATYGPVSSIDLRAAAHLGFLGPEDLVRRAGRMDWIFARMIPGLFEEQS